MDPGPDHANQTLLLTGGSGFFGKSILDAFRRGLLVRFGLERIVVVARHAQRLRVEAPELCGKAVELVNADALQLASIFDADVVIHAAASSDARRYQADPIGETRIITEGTRSVCAAVARSARHPRMLYVSSGAVYGRQLPEVAAIAEEAPVVNDSDPVKDAYTQAKRTAEAIVREMAANQGVPARIARCFAFVGPWLPRDQHFAIGNFLDSAMRGMPVVVRALHPVIRSYLHADDLAVWLLRLATADGERCEAYNVGSDVAVSIRDLAALVAEVAGVGMSLPEVPQGRAEEPLVTPDRYVPDVSKAQCELGLTVTIPLRVAVEQTLHALSTTGRKHVGCGLEHCPP